MATPRSNKIVAIHFNEPHGSAIREIVIEWDSPFFTIIRVPETDLNTATKYDQWARGHVGLGKKVLDAVWLFCQREYHTGGLKKQL